MRRLFAAVDIDFEQWRALTLTLLKLDFRSTKVGSQPGQQLGAVATPLASLLVYGMFGLVMALTVTFGKDLFLTGMVVFTLTMFAVGTAVLLDHNSAIASPADYQILGFRPISARTYFAVRLTNVLIYTTALTTAAVWLPVGALFLRYGAAVGAAGILAFYACGIGTTLAILTGYAATLRLFGPDTVRRALSYLQFSLSFLVYGGGLLMSKFLTRRLFASLAFAKSWWMLLYPATWFTGYLELADGRVGAMEISAAGASLVALAIMVRGLGGRLSLDYSEQLGTMLAGASAQRPAAAVARRGAAGGGGWLPFQSGESRAVRLLVRSQFRNDLQFKMGVLSILPMTLLYMGSGLTDGAIGDPFVPNPKTSAFPLVTMAVMMFPPMLKMQVSRSAAFRASWIFFACPSDRMKIIRASKDVLVAFFLLPYLAFLAAVYAYFVSNWWHVLLHVSLLGLISHLLLQFTLLIDPDLPFSKPPAAKGGNSIGMFLLIATIIIVSIVLQVLSPVLYRSRTSLATVFGAVVLASLAVDWLTRARIERQTAALEFEG